MKINFEVETNEFMEFFKFLSTYAQSEAAKHNADRAAEEKKDDDRKDRELKEAIVDKIYKTYANNIK